MMWKLELGFWFFESVKYIYVGLGLMCKKMGIFDKVWLKLNIFSKVIYDVEVVFIKDCVYLFFCMFVEMIVLILVFILKFCFFYVNFYIFFFCWLVILWFEYIVCWFFFFILKENSNDVFVWVLVFFFIFKV